LLGHRGDVAGGYEEWAAARSPALLRFAHALTEDGPAAEAAVRAALVRTCKAWPTIERGGDPDLVARRLVVDATGNRRRAAVVLRLLENRSDEEIAEVLGTSHAFARSQVQRGLATLQRDLPADDGSTLDDRLGRSLASTPPHPFAPPATVETAPPRGGRPAWVAALAVLALIVTVALVAKANRTPSGVITYPSVQAPTDWRYESYDGVQVQVPATWGFGGSPLHADFLQGRLGACGANQAAVLSAADHATYVSSATAFVGRPAKLTEACVPWGSDGVMPTADALWFESPLPVGVKNVGSVVAETRAIGGQHLTVFSTRSALRRQILGTAQVVDTDANGCPRNAVHQATAGPDRLTPTSLAICVYSQDSGSSVLMWSGRMDGPAAQRYADAVGQAGPSAAECPGTPTGRWVALGLHGDSGTRWDVVDLRCGAILRAGGITPLTPATVRDWARDGVTAYAIAGPAVPRPVASHFHPAVG